jgi:inner membrane protein
MASVSHLAAGALCGAVYARKARAKPVPAMTAFALLALSPDLDFIALQIGSEGTLLDHRVMTHSLSFALVAGVTVGAWVGSRRRQWLVGSCVALALASHGLLDAMTGNGPGPQLFWPFVPAPIQLAWHPIPGAEFYQDYFTTAAVPLFAAEALLCVPILALAAWILWRPFPGVAEGHGRRRDRMLGRQPTPSGD